MKTNDKTITCRIVIKDGKSELANYPQDLDHLPTVGDVMSMPERLSQQLRGYHDSAMVARVGIDRNTGRTQVDLEAKCELPTDKRPVLMLNASLVPPVLRRKVEDYVRNRLDFPSFDWEESTQTPAILRFDPFNSKPKTSQAELESELRKLIHAALEPAHP
ncbi:MAG: hypothetical protein ABI600_00290 [Luteolibacter sp.]